jgi:type IV pilus assembly protein PilX
MHRLTQHHRMASGAHARNSRTRQRGLSLIFALLALVALTLAAVVLVRSVDTGSQVLGNVGFKQDTLFLTDEVGRQAVEWIEKNGGDPKLHVNQNAAGYYASTIDTLDATGQRSGDNQRVVVDWNSDNCNRYAVKQSCIEASPQIALPNGVVGRYIVTRLCSGEGDPAAPGSTIRCARPLDVTGSAGADQGDLDYGGGGRIERPPGAGKAYRVIVRTQGARNTVSYADTIVQL